jgi:hypothetical protein
MYTTLCDTPFSSTNKADRHDIAEILLKVTLNTITLTLPLTQNQKELIVKKYQINTPSTHTSWRSALLVEENGVSHNVVLSTPHLSEIRTHNISGDRL